MFDKLKNLSPDTTVVIMHDFFIDRLIKIESIQETYSLILNKANFGGGSIRGYSQSDIKGGNAVNIAYCLAKLGLNVNLFTIADEMGTSILKQMFLEFNKVNLKISKGMQGLTTILEFPNKKGNHANVMLSSLGDIDKFGPEKIDSQEHRDILSNADAVVVVNWGSNLLGTELMEYAFKNSKNNSLRFIDPADIEIRKNDFYRSIKKFSSYIDVLSINENELNSLVEYMKQDIQPLNNMNNLNLQKVVKDVAKELQVEVDLHTEKGSIWSNGEESFFSPSFECHISRVTGAGDTWDAADIIGYLSGLNPKERLLISNAYAALYISNTLPVPASMNDLYEFLRENAVR